MDFATLKQIPTPVNSISFCPARHGTESFRPLAGLKVDAGEDASLALLRAAAPQQSKLCLKLLHTSLPSNADAMQDVLPASNGFILTVVQAYNHHRALTLRPDDVWLAILTQFCFFVNGNAEALRRTFVVHDGKRELAIVSGGDRSTMDPSYMAARMTELMQKHIVDPKLRAWMTPQFSTTTTIDQSICAIVMMGTMREYFLYKFHLMCGIPKVTLEGERGDWEEILRRLEGLKKYGVEMIAWYHLLRPIVSRFVLAYDSPNAPENLDFWNKVAHRRGGGSGPRWLSGWITAFCVFDEHGKWQGNRFIEGQPSRGHRGSDPLTLSAEAFASTYFHRDGEPYLTLDGFPYPRIDCSVIPCGYAYVDVKLNDNGVVLDTMFVAGSVGSVIYSTERTEAMPEGTRDGVRPLPAWWYFVKGEPEAEVGIRFEGTSVPPEPTREVAANRRSLHQRMKGALDALRRK